MPELLDPHHAPILRSATRALERAALEPDPGDRVALLHVALDLLEEAIA